MTDVFLPQDIIPNAGEWRLLDNTLVNQSPTTKAIQTISRPGTVWACRLEWNSLRNAERQRMQALIAELRGREKRIWINDASNRIRGSFSAPELVPFPTMAAGTTGWSKSSQYTHTSNGRVLRATRNAVTANAFAAYPTPTPTVTAYQAYAARYAFRKGRGAFPTGFSIYDNVASSRMTSIVTTDGMLMGAAVPNTTTMLPALLDESASGILPGDYLDVLYGSFARCAQVDNGPNLLTYSDQFDNAAWTKTNATVSANNATAPDGTTTGDNIVEDSSTNYHYVSRSGITVPAAAGDYCLAIALKANARTFAAIGISDGSNNVTCYFDLASATIGTPGVGASWSNARTLSIDIGNGWRYIALLARKTSSSTSLSFTVGPATDISTSSYAGDGSSSIRAWRATFAQSSVPVRLSQTVGSAAASGTGQTGSGLHLKGLPPSVTGVLQANDWIQVLTSYGSELKRLIADMDTDAAGLGYAQFEPALRVSPADSAGVIVTNPMIKMFLNSGDPAWPTRPGLFSDFSLEFIEDTR